MSPASLRVSALLRHLIPLVLLAGCGGGDPPPGPTGFVDRTPGSGIVLENPSTPGDLPRDALGGGILLLDFDGDGDLDLFFPRGGRDRLFMNEGGWTFTDVTKRAGVGDPSPGLGGAVADIDNDGDPDLFVTKPGRNVLYRNRGDGGFEDATAGSGLAGPENGTSVGATFLDIDGDGHLDLYVARRFPRVPDRLYRNRGDGTFEDVTDTALPGQALRRGMTPVAADFDGDGDADIYVANDGDPNTLWVNDGAGCFTDRGADAGADVNAGDQRQENRGCAVADLDGDAWPEIFSTSYAQDPNVLYRNLREETGELLFADETERAGLLHPDYAKSCWAPLIADFDHDGRPDLLVTAGHIDESVEERGESHRQPPTLWIGGDGLRFEERTALGGAALARSRLHRSAAFGDLDGDGDVDAVLTTLRGPPVLLENRLEKRGAWIGLDLVGKTGNRDAIGALVTVVVGDRQFVREKRVASGFLSSNEPRIFFGIGQTPAATWIEVEWPGGAAQGFGGVQANRLYRLVEGGDLVPIR